MSGIEPLALASTGLSAMQMVQGMSRAASQRRSQAAQVAQQQQHAALQQRIKERQLERQNKSQKATARARLGAAGIGSTGGSGAAVIRGLTGDLDQQIADSRSLFNSSLAGQNLLEDDNRLGDALKYGQQLVGLGQNVVGLIKEGK